LLVSHNPLLGSLSGFLLHGNLQQPLGLHTASLVALDGDIVPGLMHLSGLHHPH
jgi:phosphohistidine phosphatase